MKAWQIIGNDGYGALSLAQIDSPTPAAGQVKVAVRASSINYRDYATIQDPVARGLALPMIPNSDCAGDIVEVGAGVDKSLIGKRVASTFFQQWTDGDCSPEAMNSALGGALGGVLAEEVLLDANGFVEIPSGLSYVEAATLPCAALTAWNAMVETGRAGAGDTVLLLGTGGVSVFALQFARLLGARAIVTSSSDSKLERMRSMGAWETINYKETPEWDTAVLDLTDGAGVDVTVEVGGGGTLQRSVNATRVAGTVGLIGVLTGGQIDPTPIMRKSLRLQGIYVGSRRMFSDMNRAISMHQLKPVIDHEVPFESAPEAYRAMEQAGHLGKIVITV